MAKYLIFRTDRIGDFITSQAVTSQYQNFPKKIKLILWHQDIIQNILIILNT